MSVPSSPDTDRPDRQDSPARSDGFIRGLSEAIGGPLGTHAAANDRPSGVRRGFWTAARIVLALCCLVLVLHYIQKSPCRDGDWGSNIQYTRFCYSDVLALYYADGLSEGKVPYQEFPVEYPVLTGIFMGLLGLPIHALGQRYPEMNQGQAFYDVNALVLCALAVATCACLLSLRRRRPWDAAMFAVAPMLFITTTINWDFLAIGLATFGMLAWARRRPVLAGVLIGLGAAAKLWPVFLLGPLLLLCVRAGRLRAGITTAATAAVAWIAVNAPIYILYPDNWGRFAELNTTRPIDWGTLWYIGRWFDGKWNSGQPGDQGPFQWLSDHVEPHLNNVTLGLFILCCLGVALLIVLAPRRPRFAQVAFLVVALFLISNKVWSQQFNLWLLALIVLARPKWGAFLAWQVAEFAYFTAFYAELLGAGGRQVIPEGTFVLASTLRLVTVAVLVGLVIRDILKPENDPVRQTYDDDPDGGVLDGAPDVRGFPFGRRRVDPPAPAEPPPPVPAAAG
ncbi:glycosyltransferase family 87 protein [Spirilliplanes yamanashiensis]|uniref:Membrane protein n=1 Tax=Spirilliplanes yamanashiensis TaxID=42233 RepID=A0A8J3Y773_9ACTN|nr:glycosyltransferase 87 family protein [Spirilliplanes yamanashiensis]MDP9814921.1 putative membrane protein [Spirilliplanes yamanashiensis]GIJ02575.1 membrane protein [Spirilliplanes yamanashiensis]